MPRKRGQQINDDDALSLSGYAKVLAEIGPQTSEAITGLNSFILGLPLINPKAGSNVFYVLAEALSSWNDRDAAAVVRAVQGQLEGNANFDFITLKRWLYAHHGDAQAIIDCMAVEPPEELTIIRRLSTAGSQKLVFLANWQIAQREVVLKRFIGPEAAERLIPRELQPHPLSMQHPNIIETHLLKNKKGEPFLVERRLSMVLDDTWSSHGDQEAANLLRDIASALAFLQDKQLVHGDIKPDNIGFEDSRYVLLDFGICRPQTTFADDPTQTGSLRTRAPELLLAEGVHGYASDIWALGATVYNSVVGRFPLFDLGETPPRISQAVERANFERILAERVNNEWETRVDLAKMNEPLREIISRALNRDPKKRTTASELVQMCEKKLAAVLRVNEGPGRFSPSEELKQLKTHLPGERILALMPDSQKLELKRRLQVLKDARALTQEQKTDIEALSIQLKWANGTHTHPACSGHHPWIDGVPRHGNLRSGGSPSARTSETSSSSSTRPSPSRFPRG